MRDCNRNLSRYKGTEYDPVKINKWVVSQPIPHEDAEIIMNFHWAGNQEGLPEPKSWGKLYKGAIPLEMIHIEMLSEIYDIDLVQLQPADIKDYM